MRSNQFFAVVHVNNVPQAFRNVVLALNNGADGVFLINHEVRPAMLVSAYDRVRRDLPEQKVGVNFLGVTISESMRLLHETRNSLGFWMDDVGYEEARDCNYVEDLPILESTEIPERIRGALTHMDYKGLLFGGVDFKYQRPAQDLTRVTRTVAQFVDVVTTSGPATGAPPTVEKIQRMREAIPGGQLAIASGMTPENVESFLDYVDYFLVATGISDSHTELNPDRVKMFADKMRK